MPRLHQRNTLRGRATCCGQQATCCAQQVACRPQHVAYCPQQVACCAQQATCCAQQATSCAGVNAALDTSLLRCIKSQKRYKKFALPNEQCRPYLNKAYRSLVCHSRKNCLSSKSNRRPPLLQKHKTRQYETLQIADTILGSPCNCKVTHCRVLVYEYVASST